MNCLYAYLFWLILISLLAFFFLFLILGASCFAIVSFQLELLLLSEATESTSILYIFLVCLSTAAGIKQTLCKWVLSCPLAL